MIHPRRDLTIAVVLLVAGLTALLWSLPVITAETPSFRGGVGVVGAFVAFFAAIMAVNFWWAFRIVRRMARGEGLIARWTVPLPAMDSFIAWDRALAPNHWHATPGHAVEVAIAPEYALVDGQIYTMPTSGPQAVRAVHWLEGNPPVLLFETATFITRGATVQSYSMERGQLRIPVGERAAGQKVLTAYQDMLAGRVIIHPRRWDVRIRIGQATMLVSAAAGLWGWWMLGRTGWSGNDPRTDAAMIAMGAGIIFFLAGTMLTVLATAFRHRQRGQR